MMNRSDHAGSSGLQQATTDSGLIGTLRIAINGPP
jgi:hypothetical protein